MADPHAAPKVANLFEGDGGGEIARQAAAHVAADLEPKFTAASAENRFKLGVAFETFRHAGHLLGGALRALGVTAAHKRRVMALQLLPAFHEAIGPAVGIDADVRFLVHGTQRFLAAPLCRVAHQLRLALKGGAEIGGGLGSDSVQRLLRPVERDALVPRVRAALWEGGEHVVAATVVDGRRWLKLTLLNPMARVEDVLSVVSGIVSATEDLLGEAAA